MKKLLAVLVTVTMLLSAVGVLAFTVSADGTYTVIVEEQAGFTTENYSATNSPVVFAGGSAATDAVVSATCSYLVVVSAASETAVRKYTLIVDGTEHAAWIQANYNAGSNRSTVFITLPEGTYSEVIARGTDEEGVQMDVLKFTNITVTAAENSVPDDKEVEFTPCWTLTPSALAQGSSLNAVTVTENDFGYVTFTAGQTGDPYLYYIGGTSTKVGRWLLVKYNNHSVIPRMQLYMAQGAGITSDNNMIEFPIAANGSGWTYVIVDMATNQFYDKGVNKAEFKTMLQLLSPFAPHMVEEMWENMGFAAKYGKMAMQMDWPEHDEAKTVDSHVEMAVQVNGKLKGTVTVPVDSDEAAVVAAAMESDKVKKATEGMSVVKTILVRNKLVNLIVKPAK